MRVLPSKAPWKEISWLQTIKAAFLAMSTTHQSENDGVGGDNSNKSDAIVAGDETGDGAQSPLHPRKWQSNVTILSCVGFTSEETFTGFPLMFCSILRISVTVSKTLWPTQQMLFSNSCSDPMVIHLR